MVFIVVHFLNRFFLNFIFIFIIFFTNHFHEYDRDKNQAICFAMIEMERLDYIWNLNWTKEENNDKKNKNLLINR